MLTLKLPHSTFHRLLGELDRAGRQEIGGILMGEQLEAGRFRVTEMTFQRRSGWVARFVRSAKSALAALQRFFDRSGHRYQRFNYLGEWHSHPSFEPRPSATDHASMLEIAVDPGTGANFVVLLIVKLDADRVLEGRVTVYLPDGTVFPGTLDIESERRHAPESVMPSEEGDTHGIQIDEKV
ncbi:MAG: Mov34/MPN/PAD-1 family protein [Pseudomonadota bacterium]